MKKFFTNFIETRELKKTKLKYEVLILGNIYKLISLFKTDNIIDVIELSKKMQNVDTQEFINSLIDYIDNETKNSKTKE